MVVYRITLTKWSERLTASGRAARWNSNGRFIIYTASTRSLACLENLVHRHSIGKDDLFKIMVINIPDDLFMTDIKKDQLPDNWSAFTNYPNCQSLGDSWLENGQSSVLKVPSSIIPEEFNYLINPVHLDFQKVSVLATEHFSFDERLIKKS